MTTHVLVRAAVYAVAYAALTLAPGLSVIAYGPVQFRVAEALTVFACFDPAAIVGLTLGTALGNLASPMALVDVPFGALLTLVATALMYRIGPRVAALAAPVAVNALGVPVMLAFVLDVPYWYGVVFVALGEAAVMTTLGLGLMLLVRERGELFGLPAAGGAAPRWSAGGGAARGLPARDETRRDKAQDDGAPDGANRDERAPGAVTQDDDTAR